VSANGTKPIKGDVDFGVDLSRGVIVVSVKPKFGLESARVSQELPILDFLDIAADMIKGLNQFQREAIAQVRNGKLPTTPPPAAVTQ